MVGDPGFRYLMRIVRVLSENQAIGISNLAMAARVNHKRCNVVVDWLEQHGYVTMSGEKSRRTIMVTAIGLNYMAILLSITLPESVSAIS